MSPVAAGGFSSAAGNYARVRPTYARQAIGAANVVTKFLHAALHGSDVGTQQIIDALPPGAERR